jgi:FeS assembly SUF system regulator
MRHFNRNQDLTGPIKVPCRMLKLSKLTDYAVVVLLRLSDAAEPTDAVQTTPGIAAATGVPEPTVAKVLKALAAAGLVASQRGARGGYRLVRPLGAIPIASVISAIDGPIALTACVDGGGASCDVQSLCAVKGRWDLVNDAIRQALGAITLAAMREASIPPAFRVPPAVPAPTAFPLAEQERLHAAGQ